MKAKIFLIMLFAQSCCLWTMGKTTYIPKYRSYIHMLYGADTVSVANNLSELEMTETGGLFSVRIEHEEITKEKVKTIKRAKAAAGWMAFSAVMSGMSTLFSSNSLQGYIRSTNTRITAELAEMYAKHSQDEQTLTIELWIDNLSDSELMVNELERGLTWYILPNQSAQIKVNNPEVARLRISDVHNDYVRYVTATAGSSVKKWEVSWEDDECWIVNVYDESFQKDPPPEAQYTTRKLAHPNHLLGYRRISKTDFLENDMSIDEFNDFYRTRKREDAKE